MGRGILLVVDGDDYRDTKKEISELDTSFRFW